MGKNSQKLWTSTWPEARSWCYPIPVSLRTQSSLDHRDTHDCLGRKSAQLRQDYLKRCLHWTEENGECKMLIWLSKFLACSPRKWNSVRRKLFDQTRIEMSLCCEVGRMSRMSLFTFGERSPSVGGFGCSLSTTQDFLNLVIPVNS